MWDARPTGAQDGSSAPPAKYVQVAEDPPAQELPSQNMFKFLTLIVVTTITAYHIGKCKGIKIGMAPEANKEAKRDAPTKVVDDFTAKAPRRREREPAVRIEKRNEGSRHRHEASAMNHKQTQSQTRYSHEAATSRFIPLPEYAHGCWER